VYQVGFSSNEHHIYAPFKVTNLNTLHSMRDTRLSKLYSSGLLSSGMLHGLGWQFLTDVSGQHIGPIVNGQAYIG
jgi:hypothetical protein